MGFKYDETYAKELCEEKGLEFLGFSYQMLDKKRRCVDFICLKHRNWGIQHKPVEKLTYKQPCQYCNHKNLKVNFKEEVAKADNRIEVIDDYINWDTPLLCRCKEHGYEWMGLPSVLLQGGGCEICAGIKRWNTRGRITTEIFKQRMKDINPNIEIIGEYVGTHDFIKCRCKIHDVEWESWACNIQNGTANCPICSDQIKFRARLLSEDEFKKRMSKIAPHIIPLEEYNGLHIPMMFHCSEHQINFETTPRYFLQKYGKGCPLCSQSTGERRMINLLLEKGRNISTQHSFQDCSYINILRFDAFDLDNQIAYEYQGQQHYHPVDFDGNKEKAKIEFEEGQKRDAIKEQYCKEHNITLVKIPYWDFDDMEKYIV